jgi:hypothetical protein
MISRVEGQANIYKSTMLTALLSIPLIVSFALLTIAEGSAAGNAFHLRIALER